MMNFLGLSDLEADYKKARVVVVPVPYEMTVSYGKGTSRGPDAILEASAQVELYDEELGVESQKLGGIATIPHLSVAGVKPSALFEVITPAVGRLIDDGKWPLILGGEHSVTPPVVRAFHERDPEFTVVQFDAHADLREEYNGEAMSHACAIARVNEMCPAVQVGIRNISEPEAKLAKSARYPIFYASNMRTSNSWMQEALAAIKTDKIYITLDLDAFDCQVMPATGTPEPGGMTWWQVTDFLKMLFAKKLVVGMDIVELAPISGFHACDFLAAKLAYKSISYLFNLKDR
jgi:agmatinase